MKKFTLKTLVLFAPIVALSTGVAAEAYPEHSIKMIVPYSAGGGTDTVARLLSKELSSRLGKPVVVDNRPGGGSTIGTRLAINSKPDGYTVLVESSGLTMNPSFYKSIDYDVTQELSCLSYAVAQQMILVTHSKSSIGSLDDLISEAKSNPDKVNFGTSSHATNLPMQMLMSMSDVSMVEIPYAGSSPVVTDLVGGRVDVTFAGAATIQPFLESGQARALAIGDDKRSRLYPDIPTVSEQGYPGFKATLFNAVLVPKETPEPIKEQLSEELRLILKDPKIQAEMERLGFETVGLSPEECDEFIKNDIPKWKDVAQKAGIELR